MGSVTQHRAGDDRVLFHGGGGAELDALEEGYDMMLSSPAQLWDAPVRPKSQGWAGRRVGSGLCHFLKFILPRRRTSLLVSLSQGRVCPAGPSLASPEGGGGSALPWGREQPAWSCVTPLAFWASKKLQKLRLLCG